MRVTRQRWRQVLGVLFLAAGNATAEYRFDVWTTDSGLPHNNVTAVLQTRDDYLWLGTADGLARFDGVRFTVFNKANSPGLSNNRILALYEAADGVLWIGMDAGVARYKGGAFPSFGVEHGLPTGPIIHIWGDEAGNLWVFSQSHILSRWQEGRFRPGLPEDVAPLFARSDIGWNNSAGLWVTTRDALHVFSRGKLTTLGSSNGLPSLRMSQVWEDAHGTWWLTTEDAGVVKFGEGRVLKRFTQQGGLPRDRVSLGNVPFVSPMVCEDRKGNLWLTGVGPWLGRLRNGVFSAYSRTNTPSLRDFPETSDNSVNALLEDSEGNLWIATDRSGLIRAREQTVDMISTKQGLQAVNIYPMCEDRTGAVWFGTWSSGLARVAAGIVTNFSLSPPNHLLTALCEDRAGQLWVATHGGVSIFQNGSLTKVGVPTGLTDGVVHAICQDRSSALWFGGERELSRCQDGQLLFFTERDGLAGGSISVIIEDRAGEIWIGSYGGLSRWANGRFTAWAEKEGLPSNHIRSLYEDGDGILWIGSADGGLGRFKSGRFTRYTTRDGLFDDGVFQILEDTRGNFWMSSNRGIHRVNKRELNEFADGRRRKITSLAYGKDDGMLDAECNGGRWPAGVKTRDGKLWFPTQNGVAVIDPAAVSANQKAPPAEIEAVLVDGEPQALDRPLRILPGQANIEIQYTGLSFIHSESLSFKYRLAGIEDDWVEVGRRRTAYYSHVRPGSYTFTVIAANCDGVWNDAGVSLAFSVLPAWHQTKWFRGLVFVVLAGAVFGIYRWRINLVEQRRVAQESFTRELLQQQEAERKRIASELHDGLGQSLLVIKNRAVMALEHSSNSGKMSEQIHELSRVASHALREVRGMAQDLRPFQLDEMGLTKAILAMTRRLADSSSIQFHADMPELTGELSKDREIHFYRIIQELLTNMVKHSKATEANLTIRKAGPILRALIQDNGCGFDVRGSEGQPSAQAGFGLRGIRERVRTLGGRLQLDSRAGEGTSAIIEVPIEP